MVQLFHNRKWYSAGHGGLHPVEGGAMLEPVNLLGVEGVVHHDRVGGAIGVGEHTAQRLQVKGSGSEGFG